MRFSAVALVAILSSVAIAYQLDPRQLGNIPTCAQKCVSNNFQGCNPLDIGCICGKKTLIADLSCCVSQNCDQADQEATIQFAQQLCATNGVTVPTVAGCSGAAASATTSDSGSAASSSPTAGTTISSAPSVGSSTPSSGAAAAATTGSSSASQTISSVTTASTSNVAAPQNIGPAMGICAAVAGIFAVL